MRRTWGLALAVSSTLTIAGSLAGCGKTPSEPPPQTPAAPPPPGDSSAAAQEQSTPKPSEPEKKEESTTAKYVPEAAKNRQNQSSESGYPGDSSYSGSTSGSSQNANANNFLTNFSSIGIEHPAAASTQQAGIEFGNALMKVVGITPPLAAGGLTLDDRAKYAFEIGNIDRAYDLLIASALLGDDNSASKLTNFYRWSSIAKRPVLGAKLAVGLKLENTANLKDLRPVGTTLQVLSQRVTVNRDGQASGGSGDQGSYESSSIMGVGNTQVASPAKILQDATGEFSTLFYSEMAKSFAEGAWGEAFKNQKFASRAPSTGRSLNANGSLGEYPASSGYSGPEAYPLQNGAGPAVGAIARAASDGSLIPGTAPGAAPGSSPATGYPASSDPASGYPASGYPGAYDTNGGASGYGASGSPNGGRAQPRLEPADLRLPAGVTPVATALNYIGSDSQNKLLQLAYEKGYEVLVIFEVDVAFNRRSGIVNNTARIKALSVAEDPKDAKVIGTSKPVNSIAVAKARNKKEDDGLAESTTEIVRKIADTTKLASIPNNLTAEAVAKARLPKIANESTSKLQKLGEVLFYYDKGFIDEAQREALYREIAGRDGELILTGSAKEKKEAVGRLMAM